jgi:hypothetical protein
VAWSKTVRVNAAVVSGLPALSVPNRFFDSISASYYVTDNFKLAAGHLYTFGTHFLTLGSEYGVALGGGRMASLFAEGWIGEHGNNAVLAGLRVYFGQHDKSLIDRHRQDDPTVAEALLATALLGVAIGEASVIANSAISSGPVSGTVVSEQIVPTIGE